MDAVISNRKIDVFRCGQVTRTAKVKISSVEYWGLVMIDIDIHNYRQLLETKQITFTDLALAIESNEALANSIPKDWADEIGCALAEHYAACKNESCKEEWTYRFTFNQEQLEFMAFVQSGNDWHREAFTKVLEEYHISEQHLTSAQFKDMMNKLKGFSLDKIDDLQTALCLLNTI